MNVKEIFDGMYAALAQKYDAETNPFKFTNFPAQSRMVKSWLERGYEGEEILQAYQRWIARRDAIYGFTPLHFARFIDGLILQERGRKEAFEKPLLAARQEGAKRMQQAESRGVDASLLRWMRQE